MAGNGLQQSRQLGYIRAELYLLAAGFLCANSADNTLRLLMATLEYRQMISVDQIPRTIGLMLSDNNENVLNLILKK